MTKLFLRCHTAALFLKQILQRWLNPDPGFSASPLPSSWVFQLVDAGCRIMPRRHLKRLMLSSTEMVSWWEGRKKRSVWVPWARRCFQRCTHPCHRLSFSISFSFRPPFLCPPFISALWWYSQPWGVSGKLTLQVERKLKFDAWLVTGYQHMFLRHFVELSNVDLGHEGLENAEAFISLNIWLWKKHPKCLFEHRPFVTAVSAVTVCILKVHQNDCFGGKISF